MYAWKWVCRALCHAPRQDNTTYNTNTAILICIPRLSCTTIIEQYRHPMIVNAAGLVLLPVLLVLLLLVLLVLLIGSEGTVLMRVRVGSAGRRYNLNIIYVLYLYISNVRESGSQLINNMNDIS